MADIRQDTTILDDFNRTENPLSHGGDWARADTNWTSLKATGAVAEKGSGSYSSSYWTPTILTGDEAECWAYTKGGNSPAQAWGFHLYTASTAGHASPASYYWRMEITTGGGECILYRNGIEIDSNPTNPPTGGEWLGLIRRNGSDVEGWASEDGGANWTLYVSATDTTYTGDFYAGLSLAGTLVAFDYFGMGTGSEFVPQFIRRPWRYKGRRLT